MSGHVAHKSGTSGGMIPEQDHDCALEQLIRARADSAVRKSAVADAGPSDIRRHFRLFHEATSIVAEGTFQVVPSLGKQQCTRHCALRSMYLCNSSYWQRRRRPYPCEC